MLKNGQKVLVESRTLILHNGTASLSVRLPEDCKVGDVIQYEATVSDSSMIFPIVNYFDITVKEAAEVKGGGGGNTEIILIRKPKATTVKFQVEYHYLISKRFMKRIGKIKIHRLINFQHCVLLAQGKRQDS
jgi:hypothetical protein